MIAACASAVNANLTSSVASVVQRPVRCHHRFKHRAFVGKTSVKLCKLPDRTNKTSQYAIHRREVVVILFRFHFVAARCRRVYEITRVRIASAVPVALFFFFFATSTCTCVPTFRCCDEMESMSTVVLWRNGRAPCPFARSSKCVCRMRHDSGRVRRRRHIVATATAFFPRAGAYA